MVPISFLQVDRIHTYQVQCKQTKIDDDFSLILNAELGLFSFYNAESRFLDFTMSAIWKENAEERDVYTCNYLLTFMTQDFPVASLGYMMLWDLGSIFLFPQVKEMMKRSLKLLS